jgi:hypothetical protein
MTTDTEPRPEGEPEEPPTVDTEGMGDEAPTETEGGEQ